MPASAALSASYGLPRSAPLRRAWRLAAAVVCLAWAACAGAAGVDGAGSNGATFNGAGSNGADSNGPIPHATGSDRALPDNAISVLDATRADRRIEAANVELRRDGQPTLAAASDAQGRAALDQAALRDPAARLSIRKPGYAELLAQCPCDGRRYALSPALASLDGLRVVLGWDAPGVDLDAHLSFPGNHVYFQRPRGLEARLDLDAADRRRPETVTIARRRPGEAYTYAVHDFGHRQRPEADALARSGARVYVYVGQSLVRTYAVPAQPGNVWTVFRIDGEGRFEEIDRIAASRASADALGAELARAPGQAAAAAAVEGEDAVAANQRGEAAYRGGDLAAAIAAYQQAIELDPGYALAFSNLGLAYVRKGRAAEAIWTSRRAIALAKGPGAATIRAGAYYNIGKLYELDGQYERAMSNYLAAKREKPDKSYDEALQRVSGY
ncbi:YfaP family protein [Lysobacter enzymogenes]|uniref:YfaP family protein n=1 Tax=Lysobacter enzymogenes TaxID=69 RepID=UPI001AF892CA|nr:tetratricopeptide repeat protein [Lysobacter enzymogenes]QQQ03070.1 tetratricopeptide repeat protein [Lysobacter enzymogenes]